MQFSFYVLWFLAFLGFPIGGLLANRVIGPVNSIQNAILAGLITGAVIGLAQWLVLRQAFDLSPLWIVATAIGMAAGLAFGTGVLGTETVGTSLLIRAVITGLTIGLAQWLLLRMHIPANGWWIVVIAVGWVIGWFTTRAVGVDLTPLWTVFGASGAIIFQILTAVALRLLLP